MLVLDREVFTYPEQCVTMLNCVQMKYVSINHDISPQYLSINHAISIILSHEKKSKMSILDRNGSKFETRKNMKNKHNF